MASAPPAEQINPTITDRLPRQRRARFIVLFGFLALLAIIGGLLFGTSRRSPADATANAISDAAVVATPLPDAPTPTPLANKPTPTVAPALTATAVPPPTSVPPTSPPPTVAAPVVQRAPVSVAPPPPHDNGKGKGNGKDKGKD